MSAPARSLRLAAQRCREQPSIVLCHTQRRHASSRASSRPKRGSSSSRNTGSRPTTSKRLSSRRPTIRTPAAAAKNDSSIKKPFSEMPAEAVTNIKRTFAGAYDFPEESIDGLSMEFIERNLQGRGGRTAIARPVRPKKGGFMSMGVKPGPNYEGMGPDPEDDFNDISALAHGDLEQHRELRHYARLAAWEMPLLTKLAKDFVPPTNKEILRFRKTTYMGEIHPAQHKCVVEFCPSDIPNLTPIQLSKLHKLLGARYTPLPSASGHEPANWSQGMAKMSCEKFTTYAENQADLRAKIDALVLEAMDPRDTFQDIPLDKRHYKEKIKPKFPMEWRIDVAGRRMMEIESARAAALAIDDLKIKQGGLIDGVKAVQDSIAKLALTASTETEEPVLVRAGAAKRGVGKRISIRR